MGKISPCLLVGLLIVGIGLILGIVGIATAYWVIYTPPEPDAGFGLFKACVGSQCFTYEELEDYGLPNLSATLSFSRTIGLTITGVVLTGIAFFIGIALLFIASNGTRAASTMAALFLPFTMVGGILLIAGAVNFAIDLRNLTSMSFEFGYSFALTIVGGVLIFIGGIVGYAAARKQITPPGAQTGQVMNPPQAHVYQMQSGATYGQNQPWPQQQYPQQQYPQQLYPQQQYPPVNQYETPKYEKV